MAHIPVLRLRQQFKDVVLWVQQQLERNRAVMVLKHAPVVVPQRLGVLHGDEEGIVYTPTVNLNTDHELTVTYGWATSQLKHAKNPAIIFKSEKWFISSPVFVK